MAWKLFLRGKIVLMENFYKWIEICGRKFSLKNNFLLNFFYIQTLFEFLWKQKFKLYENSKFEILQIWNFMKIKDLKFYDWIVHDKKF